MGVAEPATRHPLARLGLVAVVVGAVVAAVVLGSAFVVRRVHADPPGTPRAVEPGVQTAMAARCAAASKLSGARLLTAFADRAGFLVAVGTPTAHTVCGAGPDGTVTWVQGPSQWRLDRPVPPGLYQEVEFGGPPAGGTDPTFYVFGFTGPDVTRVKVGFEGLPAVTTAVGDGAFLARTLERRGHDARMRISTYDADGHRLFRTPKDD